MTAPRTLLIGIGGASCSGKTTLSKHLVNILPRCLLLHQDDYAPPEEAIPVHPVHGVKDWDSPKTAIEWSRFRADLKRAKGGDDLADAKRSHEHLSLLTDLPIPEAITEQWRARFQRPDTQKVHFVIMDGFLMFYDEEASDTLDVRILIRSDKDRLQKRRLDRNERIADDSFWKDPPGIFDNIVWPAYVDAHAKHFEGRDVENGSLRSGQNISLIEERELDMQGMVERSCEAILAALDERETQPHA